MLENFPDRIFAFDEFGPLGIRPTGGTCWAEHGKPERVAATYHRTHGVTYFHGCYAVGDDTLWASTTNAKAPPTPLTALKSIRAARPDGAPIYVILDNLSAHTGQVIRSWVKRNKVRLCFTPTNASWANPIEAHFGPLRQFTLANSQQPEPHHPNPRSARLPALAQRQRPTPRHPRRPTTRTSPHPQRERHPLGRPPITQTEAA